MISLVLTINFWSVFFFCITIPTRPETRSCPSLQWPLISPCQCLMLSPACLTAKGHIPFYILLLVLFNTKFPLHLWILVINLDTVFFWHRKAFDIQNKMVPFWWLLTIHGYTFWLISIIAPQSYTLWHKNWRTREGVLFSQSQGI